MKKSFATAAILATLATTALAEVPQAVKARQGQFNLMALNLGILGGMAKGQVDYTAEAAQAAADNLVAVSMIHQPALWPEGTDTMSIDGTRAQPNLWENIDDVMAKWGAFGEAAKAMQAAAGQGKDQIGPNMGALGASCKGCHDTYRAPK
ncbi:cytochrome c [uncultured Pelagimonas sp.]|uniref:c-type cytochrome n=1 Tax=uncultured Pelagimonas sp. TaxID=1618102 RepID=UPI00262EF08B|nr:cytochrome c [uncultured Pelagimonas sp.]